MPKINQEEYEVLKEKSNVGYEWIARDESGSCFVFELKPIKDHRYELWEWVGSTRIGKIFNSSLFQFIQWEDSEPYNIQELIEEYENEEFGYHIMEAARDYEQFVKESEETEVKSIQDLIDKWDNYKNVARTVANSRAIEHADMFISDLEQLDELEVLSDKWIDEHAKAYTHYGFLAVPLSKLQNLLVPKQELPVIPKFVAEYLDFAKSDVPLMRVLELANTRNELPKWEKEYDWISANDEKFARAWLDGYEVGEPIYVLKVNGKYINRFEFKDGCNHDSIEITYSSRPHAARVDEKTKVEIEKYLNVEAEELEE